MREAQRPFTRGLRRLPVDRTEPAVAEAAGPFDVTVGPAGFLALGGGSTANVLWISTDGNDWRALQVSGLPAFINEEVLFSVSGGYAIEGGGSHVVVVCVDKDGNLRLLVGSGLQ